MCVTDVIVGQPRFQKMPRKDLVGNLVLIAVIRASFDLQCLSLMIGPDATLAFDLEGHFQGHKGHQGSNKVKTQFESTL